MYLKIIAANGEIINAEKIDNPVYIKKTGILERCTKLEATGILSQDGSTAYRFANSGPEMQGYLTAEKITKSEYDDLILHLTVPDVTEEPEVIEEEPDNNILTADKMRLRIIELEEKNTAQAAQIEMLESCILEMSELVYG